MIDFTMAETMMVEMALNQFMKREMSKSDREICERAALKIELNGKGAEIREMLNRSAGGQAE